jgi:hypothetical protein
MPLGVIVDVARAELKDDFEPVLEAPNPSLHQLHQRRDAHRAARYPLGAHQ